MAVCQFFLRGTCRFGDQCRNEHPQNRGSAFGNSSWAPGGAQKALLFSLDTMNKDFDPKVDKPLWPLSTYGPAKHEPNLLANLDESFEELHFKAFTAMKSGTTSEYVKYEQEKTVAADQVYNNVRANMKDAFETAKKQTTVGGTEAPPDTASPSAFGASRTASAFGGSAFGGTGSAPTQPSAFGASNAPSAFGPVKSASPAFGQPAFGQTGFAQPAQPKSAFGQPAQPKSAFGQTAQPTSAFGQPAATSAFGQPVPATSAFGQPAPSTSAFGQPARPTSAFGQPAQPRSAFGQPSQPTSAFGQPSQPAFGQSAFGKPASAFGTSALLLLLVAAAAAPSRPLQANHLH
ncbi:hypothetical protein EWM64_g2340 [Hericium alpestre]|uniref:C3H1-type domain-containing protein n=1 Tax=Hericium alpestre TaxID=135208 RepID=A0A4Z0A7R3_9AGAM|nr:hypothetical protein EWM64_g2340 [Hericium alpestre]